MHEFDGARKKVKTEGRVEGNRSRGGMLNKRQSRLEEKKKKKGFSYARWKKEISNEIKNWRNEKKRAN